REAAFGEALVFAANGVVTAEAKAAFEKAVALDANSVQARYFLGLAAEQDGDRAQAAATWRALIEAAPADAPWIDLLRRALARVDRAGAPGGSSGGASSGPSDEQVAASSELAPGKPQPLFKVWAGGFPSGRIATAPMSRDGCGSFAPTWYSANPIRRALPSSTRAVRLPAMRSNCVGSTISSKDLVSKAERRGSRDDPQATTPLPHRCCARRAR